MNDKQLKQLREKLEVETLRTEVLTDFVSFVDYFFPLRYGRPFVWNWHHFEMAEVIDKVVRGEIQYLCVNIPPRYTKTEFFSIFLPAYGLAKNANSKFITTSYSQDLTLLNSTRVQEIIKLPEYQRLFPETKLKRNKSAKEEWENVSDGGLKAVSTGTGITGWGAGQIEDSVFAGAIVIDDPLKPQDRSSEVMRAACIDYFKNTLLNRRNNEKVPIIIIMQRLHEDDLSGYVTGYDEHGKKRCELPFAHLCLPAIDQDGNVLWEAKHTKRDLLILQSIMGNEFAGQYLQLPAPAEGAIFKDKDWERYTPGTPEQPDFILKIFTADCAEGEKQENDWRVIQCWGKYLNRAYLIDQFRYKADDEIALQLADDFWEKHKPNYAIVEKKSTGSALITHWRKAGKPTLEYNPPNNMDKVAKARRVQPYCFNRQVFLPKGVDWIADYLLEHRTFPNAKHDDQVDCTTIAIGHLLMEEGVLIYPEFNELYNVLENITKLLHKTLIISINADKEPAALFVQLNDYGQVRILDSLVDNCKKEMFIRKVSTKQIIDFNFSVNNLIVLLHTGKNQDDNPFDWYNAIKTEFGINPINYDITAENNDIMDITARYLSEIVIDQQTGRREQKFIINKKNDLLISAFKGGCTFVMKENGVKTEKVIKQTYPYTNLINCVHHLIYYIALRQKSEERKKTRSRSKLTAKGM